MRLTLIRHTAVDVPRGVCYGQTDVPLCQDFGEAAGKVAAEIAGRKFDRVFTSPLSRCTRLAGRCGYPEAVRDRRLMEMNFGEWEMKRWDEIDDPRLAEWFDDYLNLPATGGESFADQYRRVEEFLDELREGGYESVAIFAHGGTIVQILLILGLADPENPFAAQPPCGGVVTADV